MIVATFPQQQQYVFANNFVFNFPTTQVKEFI